MKLIERSKRWERKSFCFKYLTICYCGGIAIVYSWCGLFHEISVELHFGVTWAYVGNEVI